MAEERKNHATPGYHRADVYGFLVVHRGREIGFTRREGPKLWRITRRMDFRDLPGEFDSMANATRELMRLAGIDEPFDDPKIPPHLP